LRRTALLVVGLAALACGGDGGDGPVGAASAGRITVTSRNLFLGAGLEETLGADAVLDAPGTVRRLFEQVQASDPPARMARIADEIAATGPDLVGLQEAAIFRTRSVIPGSPEVVAYDFAELLLGALRERGLSYRAAAQITNFDATLPDDTGRAIRFSDRDVTLVREGVVTSEEACAHFDATLSLTVGGIPFGVPRSWCSVRAVVDGTEVRFVNTHLEAVADPIQEAQARELAALLAADARPAILAGDLNSAADGTTTQSYATLRGVGFDDVWSRVRPGDPGLTCCFPTDLRTVAPLRTRIDVVLFRGPFQPVDAAVVGEEPADRTASGLWPSDHAGVVGALSAPR
jgi:endonuclease/exonuclease/phosphatase family metal-dependent hydrolase